MKKKILIISICSTLAIAIAIIILILIPFLNKHEVGKYTSRYMDYNNYDDFIQELDYYNEKNIDRVINPYEIDIDSAKTIKYTIYVVCGCDDSKVRHTDEFDRCHDLSFSPAWEAYITLEFDSGAKAIVYFDKEINNISNLTIIKNEKSQYNIDTHFLVDGDNNVYSKLSISNTRDSDEENNIINEIITKINAD